MQTSVRGQVHHRIGEEDYVRKDGRRTRLIVWRVRCRTCDAEFQHTSPQLFDTGKFPANCKGHRQAKRADTLKSNLTRLCEHVETRIAESWLHPEHRQILADATEVSADDTWLTFQHAGSLVSFHQSYGESPVAELARRLLRDSGPLRPAYRELEPIFSDDGDPDSSAIHVFAVDGVEPLKESEAAWFSKHAEAILAGWGRRGPCGGGALGFVSELAARTSDNTDLLSELSPSEDARPRVCSTTRNRVSELEHPDSVDGTELAFWDPTSWAKWGTTLVPTFPIVAHRYDGTACAILTSLERNADGRLENKELRLRHVPNSGASIEEVQAFANTYIGYWTGARAHTDAAHGIDRVLRDLSSATVDDLRAALQKLSTNLSLPPNCFVTEPDDTVDTLERCRSIVEELRGRLSK